MNNIPYLRIEDTDLDVIDGDRGAHYPNKSELQKSGYCVFLNTGNVTKDGFDFSELEFITEEKDRLLRKGKAKANDIVLTTRGTVGNVGYVSENIHHKIIRINSGMVIVRTNSEQFLPYYVYIFFRSESFKNQCLKNGSGSAQPQLPISALKNISIPCLSITTQQYIVSIIQALDAKIELNNRINVELEAMAKTLYDYWFVQFDFPFDFAQGKPDANGKPYKSSGGTMVYNPTLKREIPEGWHVKPIKVYLSCNSNKLGIKHGLKEINYLDTANITKNVLGSIQHLVFGVDTIPSRANMVVSKNDILYSTVRPNLQHFGLIKKPAENMIASTGFAVLSSNKSAEYNPVFYLHITSEPNAEKLIRISESSKSSYPSISPEDILNLYIALPLTDDLVEKASSILNPIFEKISEVQSENKELESLRDWLLPMLMNGQVTVK